MSDRISFRLTESELTQLQAVREKLQRQYGEHMRVTQKLVFLVGLDMLAEPQLKVQWYDGTETGTITNTEEEQ